ncbi:response regulator [uncultured Robinsoniella sp.]|uniref:response regulator transcription factor n=1 Tax=uncultured Robinsoniella sp. TaxID=904190 RepID=UPI00374E7D03
MLKILVVDDEPRVRRGISSLIEEYEDKYELAGCCESAAEAIEFFTREVPDVVVTDIKMPHMDGLELINYLKHRYQNLEFVILSGYGDFEYAKKALQYQVYDFLLKPVEEEEFYQVLDAIAKKRTEKRKENEESAEDNHFFNLLKASAREEEQHYLKVLGFIGKEERYRVMIIETQYINAAALKSAGGMKRLLKQELYSDLKIYNCFDRQSVLIWNRKWDGEEFAGKAEALLNNYNCKVLTGVSGETNDYLLLKEQYMQALIALKNCIYERFQTIFVYDKDRMDQEIKFPKEIMERMINAMKSLNDEGLCTHIKALMEVYKESNCSILRLKNHMMFLGTNLERLCESYGIDSGYSKNILSFISNIEEMKTFSELEELLSSNITEISAGIRQIHEYKTKSYRMNNIMKYVDENYTRDISLQEVAEYANLSVGYLSNYFKTEAGMNFIDYITYRRMERAKELLVSTNDKIYRIAEQVGYTNSQYFTTLFKKQIGVTPAEYRQYL